MGGRRRAGEGAGENEGLTERGSGEEWRTGEKEKEQGI